MFRFAPSAARLPNSSPVLGAAATAPSQQPNVGFVVMRAMTTHGLSHGEVLYHRIDEIRPKPSQGNADQHRSLSYAGHYPSPHQAIHATSTVGRKAREGTSGPSFGPSRSLSGSHFPCSIQHSDILLRQEEPQNMNFCLIISMAYEFTSWPDTCSISCCLDKETGSEEAAHER